MQGWCVNMLENFIFENHLGLRFVGLENGVYMNYNELRNYSWNYDTINNKISRFYRSIKDRKLPLIVYCNSDEEATKIKNRIHELAEADIQAKLPGKVYIGEYYTNGFITASTKSDYLITKRLCKLNLNLTSNNPAWYREQTHAFIPGEDGSLGYGEGTDYPYDYKYDYSLSLQGKRIMCDAVGNSAFKLLIYGEVTNPSVIIGGHTYTVNGTVGKGETLLIDGLKKTITLTTATGNKVNWYAKRERKNYIFEPLKPGQNTVAWNGTFGFDLTVIEERSEPKWT